MTPVPPAPRFYDHVQARLPYTRDPYTKLARSRSIVAQIRALAAIRCVRNSSSADRVGGVMAIHRLNHAVLFVRDVERSVAFYRDVLGFRRVDMTPEGFASAAFMQAPGSTNDHDLGLFELGSAAGPSGAGRTTVGLYHLAWEVDTLDALEE